MGFAVDEARTPGELAALLRGVAWERPVPCPPRWSRTGPGVADNEWVHGLGPAERSTVDRARGRLLEHARR